MKLRLEPIRPEYLSEAVALYEEAFPPEERRLVEEWTALMESNDLFKAAAIVDDKTFCGLLTSWTFPDFTYVEHFAVSSRLRGSGIGGRALQVFLAREGERPVVLEVEPPETETARRRIAFYERSGLNLLSFPYLQPPYRPEDAPLPLRLMATQYETANRLAARFAEIIHRHVYGQ